MNPKAEAIVNQLVAGMTVQHIKRDWITGTVSHLTEKSVHFTDGTHEHKRSMGAYKIIG